MEKYFDSTLSAEERAIALTDAMTVEEQASQLRYDAPAVKRLGIPAYNWWNEGLHGLAFGHSHNVSAGYRSGGYV